MHILRMVTGQDYDIYHIGQNGSSSFGQVTAAMCKDMHLFFSDGEQPVSKPQRLKISPRFP
jgi:hypothetical protein